MTCDDLLKMLNDYVDGDIDPGVCENLQSHLEGCNPCRIVVDNIRQTITVYKGCETYEEPLKFRRSLHETLRKKWDERHCGE